MFIQHCFGRLVLALSLLAFVLPLVHAADSPSHVFVVNTGDGSVSLVDLTKILQGSLRTVDLPPRAADRRLKERAKRGRG